MVQQRILPLLDAFLGEIDGVRSGRDIEHIHRMRVASRRLRAALPLFKSCFPKEKFRKWMPELQKITRALGDARDTDVQIAFLLRLKEKRVRKQYRSLLMAKSGWRRPSGRRRDSPSHAAAEKTEETTRMLSCQPWKTWKKVKFPKK